MVLPERTRDHVLTGLNATPRILALLSGPLSPTSPVWELSLPHRFTLKETMAHLADWDRIFLQRAQATIKGQKSVEDPDSEKMAKERNYGRTDPHVSIQKFGQARYDLVRFFRGLKPDEWALSITHPRHGAMSLEVQAVHVLGHDGYHLDAVSSMLAIAGVTEPSLSEPSADQAV